MKASKILFLFFLGILSLSLVNTQPVKSQSSGTIYIRSDGTVEGTDKIQRDGNVYTLTGNIYDSIVVERDNIVVDGAGYTLQGTGSGKGVAITSRRNVRVKNVTIKAFHTGIAIFPTWVSLYVPGGDSSNNVVSGNTITNTHYGIALGECSNNAVSDNTITNSTCGIWIADELRSQIVAEKNGVYGNTITNNEYGIYIRYASNNVFRNNHMSDNKYNFKVECGAVMSEFSYIFANNVDASNTVNGKPICYWVNKQGGVVPPDAGYVALIDCTSITVQNLNLTSNGQGILLYSTADSVISQNHITNNEMGIYLVDSPNINVTENNITDNDNDGLHFWSSNNADISRNNITNNHENGINLFDSRNAAIIGNTVTGNNGCGIKLWALSSSNIISANYIAKNNIGIQIDNSDTNNITGNKITNNSDSGIRLWDSTSTIIRNNVTDNGYGIQVYSCSNVIHHNNFVDNTVHAHTDGSIGTWDNGSEGNYWSDYNGKDTNGNGIGDTPYVIDANNQDDYPLMHYWGSPTQPSEPFPTLIVAAIAIIAVAGVALLVYFAKVKKTTGKVE